MSSQKGNSKRSRPQKYQNAFAFKNTLHDTSHKTKFINNIQVCNVCERCKKIIDWKIKYKKYKPLKAPSKCTKCNEKTVKHAYHIMCGACATEHHVCPKCGEKRELVLPEVKEEPFKLDRELRLMVKSLSERKRRDFNRYMKRKDTTTVQEDRAHIKDDLLDKLKSLMSTNPTKYDSDESDSSCSDIDGDNYSDDSTEFSYNDNDIPSSDEETSEK